MKLTIFFYLAAFMVSVLSYKWDPEELECVNELKIDKKLVENNPAFEKVIPEDNEDLNKFLECSWKKWKYIHDDGNMDWERLYEIVDELTKEEENKSGSSEKRVVDMTVTIMKGMFDKCREKHLHGKTPGQTAAKIQNCVVEQIVEYT